MRVLVAGAAGFLGFHLCARLLKEGAIVHGIDNLQTGRTVNIDSLSAWPAFSFTKHDVIEPYHGDYNQIFNLACPASPPKYQKDPVHTARTNFIGTDNLLQLACRGGAKFFQASTSEVYGDPIVHPQSEAYRGNVSCTGPRACYDEGKRIAETLCYDYRRQYGVDVRVARIFNTYGPRMSPQDGRVVSNLIMQALNNEPMTIYGDGSQTRSFCYVDDLIEGFLKLMRASSPPDTPINLGNPVEFTVRELAAVVLECTGGTSEMRYCELPVDDPRQRRPDITMAKLLLGWEPQTDLRDGLRSTCDYFADLMSTSHVTYDSRVPDQPECRIHK